MHKSLLLFALLLSLFLPAEDWGPWKIKIADKLTPQNAQEISAAKLPADSWQTFTLTNYLCDLDTVAGKKMPEHSTAVAACTITSERDKTILVGMGADWLHACFINGTLCHDTGKNGNRTGNYSPMNFVFPVQLKAGDNTLAVFLSRGKLTWNFAFSRLIDSDLLPKISKDRDRFMNKLMGPVPLTCSTPYVVRLSADAATVGIEFSQPVAAGIRFKAPGDAPANTQWTISNGLRNLSNIHTFTLTGLTPATTYAYDILTLDEPTAKEIVQTSGSFRTYPGSGLSHTFFALSDNQVGAQKRTENINLMFKNCGMKNADFLVSLGDMDSAFDDFRLVYFQSFFDVLKANGYPRQAELMRGNHEYRGSQTDLYHSFFGTGYCAFRYGDAFYIALDCGEDKPVLRHPNHYTLRHDVKTYFQEQAAWFEKVITSEECRNAKVRIVFAHTVPFQFENGYFFQNVSSVVGKYLYGAKPLVNIDLWLCGDIHSPYRFDPVVKTFTGAPRKFSARGLKNYQAFDRGSITFPVFVNDGPGGSGITISVTKVQVSDNGIRLTNLSPEGKIQDDITIRRGQPFEVHSTTFVDYDACQK